MGTSWSAQFTAPPAVDVPSVQAAIFVRLEDIVRQMSHWSAGSALCGFNRAEPGTWIVLPPDFAQVMARSLAIAEASDGAFDPTIGRLVDLWGFGPPGPKPAPGANDLAKARAQSGWRRLAFDTEAKRLRQPGGLALDLSGIAKGYAVDALSALLTRIGARHHLVEIGGELAGAGLRPDGDPWWVDLECPTATQVHVAPLRIALHGLAVATSGSYVRGDHTLDPRTGRPVDNGCISVSVVAKNAMSADGWASALTVLGHATGIALADRIGLAARIIHVDSHGHVSEALSKPMKAMLEE